MRRATCKQPYVSLEPVEIDWHVYTIGQRLWWSPSKQGIDELVASAASRTTSTKSLFCLFVVLLVLKLVWNQNWRYLDSAATSCGFDVRDGLYCVEQLMIIRGRRRRASSPTRSGPRRRRWRTTHRPACHLIFVSLSCMCLIWKSVCRFIPSRTW
jgi:hypothetical protein